MTCEGYLFIILLFHKYFTVSGWNQVWYIWKISELFGEVQETFPMGQIIGIFNVTELVFLQSSRSSYSHRDSYPNHGNLLWFFRLLDDSFFYRTVPILPNPLPSGNVCEIRRTWYDFSSWNQIYSIFCGPYVKNWPLHMPWFFSRTTMNFLRSSRGCRPLKYM